MENTPDITDYDKFDYDYTSYWKSREYEHQAEKLALEKQLSDERGLWFLDLGGSYGRHYPSYKDKFDNCIIADYSINALEQAQSKYPDNTPNLVAVNAYNLPFKDGVFQGISMIRVVHHLKDLTIAIGEVSRVTAKAGIFILEFANKVHLKARLRAILHLDMNFFLSEDPYTQKTTGNPEGTTKDTPGIILNFHPQWIRSLLVSHEFKIISKRGVSFLRIPFVKQILPLNILLFFERVLQTILGWSNIPPSIFLKLKKIGGKKHKSKEIHEILCCPSCKGELEIKKHSILCKDCNKKYRIVNGIYDLRYPKAE